MANKTTADKGNIEEVLVSDIALSTISFEPWGTEAPGGGSEFMAIPTKRPLVWMEARKLCQSLGMDLVVIDYEAKLRFLTDQNEPFRGLGYERFWLGAERLSSAHDQYEFLWIDGRKETRAMMLHNEAKA